MPHKILAKDIVLNKDFISMRKKLRKRHSKNVDFHRAVGNLIGFIRFQCDNGYGLHIAIEMAKHEKIRRYDG